MVSYKISVKTGDKKGAGTDANVYVILHGKGTKTSEQNLDTFFKNDFERGSIDTYSVDSDINIPEVQRIELWRDNNGLLSNWYLDWIEVTNVETGITSIFPAMKWIKEDNHYFFKHIDTCLPQDDPFKDMRMLELQTIQKDYQLQVKVPGLPAQPATFDGQGSLIDYKSHFDACSRINGWTESEKGLYLAVSLRGQAQGVLGNLPTDKRQDFKELVMSLEERFSPANQTELYRTQLRERRQKASESLPELGQDIRRLANLSYPTAPNDVRETLAKEQFIDGLMSVDMRLRIKQARPADLNDAIRHAVELEAFNKAEIKQDNGKGYSRAITRDGTNSDASDKTVELPKNMQTALTDLQQEVRALKQTRAQYQNHKNRGCFNCGKFGHFKKDCPDSSVKRGHPNSQNLPEVSHEKQNGVIGVNKLANEAGMFIEAKVNGCKAKMLIDTGATVSLISKKMFDSMKSQVLSPMDICGKRKREPFTF
ncbi:unnamed protein product [Mytilus edulis]|uniref:CCHC-type domain-containing protein n=1 Tax=Mytilus edulis TaxID=6550 RepID=A0A8S3Q4D8_MYTED|nr:unnamed protein product [Mytilus edulis]